MKKLLLILILATASVFAANSTLLGGTLTLTSVNYYPFPAQPGNYIDFFTSVSNGANFAASDVSCKIDPSFPFSVDSKEDSLKKVGTLAPTQAFLLKYKVRVDENAVPGDNELKLSCKTESSDWITAKLSVFVQPKDAVLSIENVSVFPREIKPGEKATVRVVLKNLAKVYLRDISVSLSLNDSSLPFAPIEGSSEKRISSLGSQEETTIDFRLVSSPDSALKVYKVPLLLNYYDSLGKQYSKKDLVGLQVSGTPEIFVSLENDFIKPNVPVRLSFKVSNAGVSDAKFLSLNAKTADGAKLISSDVSYVGTISSDNYETVSMQYYFNSPGDYAIPVVISYKDINNNAYSLNSTVTVKVYSNEEALLLGLEKKPDNTFLFVIVFLVLVFLAFKAFGFLSKRHAK